MINSFFLPGGILDPEGNQEDQNRELRAGESNAEPVSFFLPPVETGWSSRPLSVQQPSQLNNNPLTSDLLLSNQGRQSYDSSESLFGGLDQRLPPGLRLQPNDNEEISWLRSGTPSHDANLPLGAFKDQHSISADARLSGNQRSISQSENQAYCGSPGLSSEPAPPVDSGLLIGNSSIDQVNPAGTIGSESKQSLTSGYIEMQPPPGFNAIAKAPVAPASVPKKGEQPAGESHRARRPSGEKQSRRSSPGTEEAQKGNSKLHQTKETAVENQWVETGAKRGSISRDKHRTPSEKSLGDPHGYFGPLATNSDKQEEQVTPETTQMPSDANIEDTNGKDTSPPVSGNVSQRDGLPIETSCSSNGYHHISTETSSARSPPKKPNKDSVSKKQIKTAPHPKPRAKKPVANARRNPEQELTRQDSLKLNGNVNSSTGNVIEPLQGTIHWLDEILFPSVKQTLSGVGRLIHLCAAIVYHLYAYAIQDVQTYDSNELIGLTFFQIPLINSLLGSLLSPPQFTPHLLSYGILFHLCRPRKLISAASAGTFNPVFGTTDKRRKGLLQTHFAHHLCRRTLRCIQISLPFVCILEGFENPQTLVMRLTQGERIVLFYFLRSLRESIVLSPIILGTLLVQAILAYHFASTNIWLELVVIQCSLAVGMASVNYVTRRSEIGGGLQS